ncbi:MAG: TlpA disulfide reductase family protein [Methylococcales bacterium]|nr:TlpA disulfide reductase family protein [Methylococcales bacterium]
MSHKPKLLAGIVFICLLISGLWLTQPQKLSQAPNAVFKTIRGDSISLADLKGKPVLVTFWATDCPSCLAEIPDLISLYRQYADKGLTIIAVAMSYDPPNRVLSISETRQLPYPVALDPGAEHAVAFGNVQFTPTTFLIDRRGGVIMQKTGRFDAAALQAQLETL